MCKHCQYVTWSVPRQTFLYKKVRQHKTAGVILLCKGLVLLVRSFSYWGFPKGTLKDGEDPFKGAVREMNEETGIQLTFDENEFQRWDTSVGSTLFIKEIPELTKAYLPKYDKVTDVPNNDATGVGWFRIGCVDRYVTSNTIVSNRHLRLFLNRIKRLTRLKCKQQQAYRLS